MRGKPGRVPKIICHLRNIPAYAGKTKEVLGEGIRVWEHPRVCGENLVHHREGGADVGNIPAYAGKTSLVKTTDQVGEEHPRVCGENEET